MTDYSDITIPINNAFSELHETIISKNKGYIYKTTVKDGKIYVGQKKSSTFVKSYYGTGLKLRGLYKSDCLSTIILEWVEFEYIREINKRECYWIEKLDSANPEIGYNKNKGPSIYEGLNEYEIMIEKGEFDKISPWSSRAITKEELIKKSNQYKKISCLLYELDSLVINDYDDEWDYEEKENKIKEYGGISTLKEYRKEIIAKAYDLGIIK